MYSDSHCHLDSFNEQQRARLMEQAARDQVVLMLTTGLDLETSRESIRIAEQYPSVYAGIGYHPSEAVPIEGDIYGQLAGLAMSEKVVVISEIGLDYAWQNAPARDIQEACFRRNVELAKELSLPLQLHIVNAHREAFRILEEMDALDLGGAIHEQISNETDLYLWLQKGYYITVGLRVLRTDATWQEFSKVVGSIPIERLLLETDAYGGGQIDWQTLAEGVLVGPAQVKQVAEKVAEMRGMSPDEIGRITTENLKLFLRINA